MRFKLTLILLLANIAVFFALWQLGRQTEQPVQPRGLISAELTAPDRIEITNKQTNETDVLERKADTWRITKPVQWAANESTVASLISQLLFLEDKDSFPITDPAAGGSTLASYGLDPAQPSQPHLILKLSKGSLAETLYIGNTTAANSSLYVRNPADNLIHTVPMELLQSLDVPLKDLRDESIFTIKNFEIQSIKVRVTNPSAAGGGPAQDAGPLVTLNKDGENWSIDSVGVTSAADSEAVNNVVSKLTSLTAERFLTPDEQDPARQFTNPFMRLEIDGTDEQQTLLLGGNVPNAPEPQYYAKLEDPKQEDNPTVFIVKAETFKDLLNAQESLREHHFLDFDPEKVSDITVDAGTAKIHLQKLETGNDPWQIVAQDAAGAPTHITADTALVKALLDNLRKLEAQHFASDDPSDDDRRGFGLIPDPERQVTLTMNADKPITLRLGVGTGSGAEPLRFYTQVDEQKFVYELGFAQGGDILHQLQINPLYYRNRTLEALPAGAQITSLQLTQLNDDGSDAKIIFNHKPDFSKIDTSKDTDPWHAFLLTVDEPQNLRDATKALEDAVRKFQVDSYVQESFTDHFQLDADSKTPRSVPWRYRLDAGISLPAAGQAPSQETRTFYFSERLGGDTQYGGTSQPMAMIFNLPSTTIGALNYLTLNQTPPPVIQKAIDESAQPIDARPAVAPAPESPPPSPLPSAPSPSDAAVAPSPALINAPEVPSGLSGNTVAPNILPPNPIAP